MFFTPAVYEHAARVIKCSPWQVSRSTDLMYRAHARAYEIYHHCPVVVGIDIYNLEAEAYGAVIDMPDDLAIPAISSRCCQYLSDMLDMELFDPRRAGRIPMVIEVGQRLQQQFPQADIRIPVSGPFSIASNVLGFDTLLTEAFLHPEQAAKALQRLVRGQIRFCQEIDRNGLEVAFFESAATPPLISPAMFAEIEFPALAFLLKEAEAILGHPVPCIIGGDTAPLLDMIMKTGTRYVICPSETDQALFMQKMAGHPQVMVRVNMDPTCLAANDLSQVYTEIDRLLHLIDGRENCCIGTGVLPYETEPVTVLAARDYVAERS